VPVMLLKTLIPVSCGRSLANDGLDMEDLNRCMYWELFRDLGVGQSAGRREDRSETVEGLAEAWAKVDKHPLNERILLPARKPQRRNGFKEEAPFAKNP